MLYHAQSKGQVLCVVRGLYRPGLAGGIGGPAMRLNPARRRFRNRVSEQQSRKPPAWGAVQPRKPRLEPEPTPAIAGSGRPDVPAPPADGPARSWEEYLAHLGRWRRVGQWWLFAEAELEDILDRPWRIPRAS